MAKNTGNGFRKGSVDNRTQFYNHSNQTWYKRDVSTGQFMDGKSDGDRFKGVAKEVDDRRK